MGQIGWKKQGGLQIGLSQKAFGVKKIGGTPRLFWAKSAQTIGKMGDRFCSFARERKREARARKSEGTAWGAIRRHRQSRWLSKERGCGRGKMDRCQNKGDRKSCPDLGAKEWIEWGSREKWGRIVRMELDYTRQSSMSSFTLSIYICSVFE